MSEQCTYCTPNKEGKYAATVFKNKEDGAKVTMQFCKGSVSMLIEMPGARPSALFHPIRYCPMCGKPVHKDGPTQ